MTKEILNFFQIQRSIFGVCPHSGEIFRLSECKIFLKTKPKKDWMDVLKRKELHLEKLDERIEESRKRLEELAHRRGRRLAQAAVRKLDPVFAPRKLNPDDAKVIFHPIDYLVFKGMNGEESIKRILLLAREARSSDRRGLQRSIEKVVDRGKYEWLSIRVLQDGTIKEE